MAEEALFFSILLPVAEPASLCPFLWFLSSSLPQRIREGTAGPSAADIDAPGADEEEAAGEAGGKKDKNRHRQDEEEDGTLASVRGKKAEKATYDAPEEEEVEMLKARRKHKKGQEGGEGKQEEQEQEQEEEDALLRPQQPGDENAVAEDEAPVKVRHSSPLSLCFSLPPLPSLFCLSSRVSLLPCLPSFISIHIFPSVLHYPSPPS